MKAQVELTPTRPQSLILEPGQGLPMEQPAQTAPYKLGDGVIVFEFILKDVDPLVDDNDPWVRIYEIDVHNLGSAACEDFSQLGIIYENRFLDVIDMAAECSPGDGAVTWGVIADLNGTELKVPDNTQTATFKVALRTADPDALGSVSQNHTVQLRVILHFLEKVGSPPEETGFSASVTDPAPDRIWNGGINAFSTFSFAPRSIPPAQTGSVALFEVCDRPDPTDDQSSDPHGYDLFIKTLVIRQGPLGNASFSDLEELRLIVREGDKGSPELSASISPSPDFNGPGFYWNVGVTVRDDECRTFELVAKAAPTAAIGRRIQPEILLLVEEPIGVSIPLGATPAYPAGQAVLIGGGVVQIRSMEIRGLGSLVPLEVLGITEGVRLLKGQVQFDPEAVSIKGVALDNDYQTRSLEIDNRRGILSFELELKPGGRAATGLDGPEAIIRFKVNLRDPQGNAGRTVLLLLQIDRAEYASNPGRDVRDQLQIVSGRLTIVPGGDVDLDGRVTVRDALLLALELLSGCPNLDDEMRFAADVVISPGAPREGDPGLVPTCRPPRPDLDSADVAAIARLAIAFGFDEPTPASASAALTPIVPLHVRSLSVFPAAAKGKGHYTLRVEGQGIAAAELQIYDLMGRLRFAGRARGDTLTFALRDAQGRPPANGVYLYVVKVRGVDGRVWRSGVKKLVVLR